MDKKTRIIETAMTLIEQQGYEKTSVSQIVKETGIAQGTFYLYFKTKSEIVPEIAKLILHEQIELVQKYYDETNQTYDDLILCLVKGTYELTRVRKTLINVLYSGLAFDDSFELWEEAYRPYYEWLEAQLKAHPGLSSKRAFVKLIVGVIENSAENFYLFNQHEQQVETSMNDVVLFLKSIKMKEE